MHRRDAAYNGGMRKKAVLALIGAVTAGLAAQAGEHDCERESNDAKATACHLTTPDQLHVDPADGNTVTLLPVSVTMTQEPAPLVLNAAPGKFYLTVNAAELELGHV
jgi:hypothetical protein